MTYRIAAVEIHDYKRIHDVVITPDADSVWVLIGGRNAQGKTSVIDAIEALLGGKDAVIADPVRHGADCAELRAKLAPDGDAPVLTIRRKIELDGSTTLEVRDDIGPVRSPQAMLDKIVGSRFIDPLEFLRLKAPEQRAELLRLIDKDGAIAALDQRRGRLTTRRTEIGREIKRLAGAIASTPEVTPGDLIDVSSLSDEYGQICDALSAAQVRASKDDELSRTHRRHADRIRQLETELARERAARDTIQREMDAVHETLLSSAEVAAARERRDSLKTETDRAGRHNQDVAVGRQAAQRRAALVAEHDQVKAEHAEIEASISDIDEDKTRRLAGAALPVDGLGVTADGLTFRGALFANASGAQRMSVAIAVAAAAHPQLRDVWIRDAAILHDEAMADVAELARRAGLRLWLERVGTRDDGVIEIRDGRVVESKAGA